MNFDSYGQCGFSFDVDLVYDQSNGVTQAHVIVDDSITSPDMVSFFWKVNNGDDSYDPEPTFDLTTGNYLLCGVASNADSTCTLTECKRLAVAPPPCFVDVDTSAKFKWQDFAYEVIFTIDTDSTSPDIDTYYWDFGDGTSSTDTAPVHLFSAGFYEVCLVASQSAGNCSITHCFTLEFTNPDCEAIWSYSLDYKKRQGLEVEFEFDDKNSSKGLQLLEWDLGNGDLVNRKKFKYQFLPDIYEVCLNASRMDSQCVAASCDTLYLCRGCFVWPGDADNDSVVDNLDVLAIGIAYDVNGYPREDVTTSFAPHSIKDWDSPGENNYFRNGVNKKHADSDGDGSVNLNDVPAIGKNFGRVVPNGSENLDRCGCVDPTAAPISLVANIDTVQASDTVVVQVVLGDSLTTVGEGYGISFDIDLNFGLINANSVLVNYNHNGLWPFDSIVTLTHIDNRKNRVETAISRTNHINGLLDGPVAELIFVMEDDLVQGQPGKPIGDYTDMVLQLCNVKLIDRDENEIDLCSHTETIVVDTRGRNGARKAGPDTESVENIIGEVEVFPNPFENTLMIHLPEDAKASKLQLRNTLGQLLVDFNASEPDGEFVQLDVETIPAGIYFLSVLDGDGQNISIQKLIKD